MNISYRNIPKFDTGGSFNLLDWIDNNTNYYNWYSSIYPNALKLMGDPLKQRNNFWNKQQLSSSHYTTDDLRRSAYNNYLYTNDYLARDADINYWAKALQDLANLSDLQIVDRYNLLAQTIRDAREAPQTYNTKGYTETNRIFRTMFNSRSKQGTNTPLYTIGYLDDLEDIEGTSTWQRRMDRYEKKFEEDTEEGQKNRIFYINKPDGTKVKVYKKENGDIALFPNELPSSNKIAVGNPDEKNKSFNWDKIRNTASKILPGLLAGTRLAGTLINNNKIYDEALKGIKPTLMNPYHTHRKVVGDEATKQSYYRMAAQGQTSAARPITSDASLQSARQFEAKRIGDELRAKGDLADNAEIRRTSDESNLHQWANVLRDTEVANTNRASIDKAEGLRHTLLALKQAAQGTAVDNWLKEIEYKQRQKLAKAEALQDLIWLLDYTNNLLNDPEYLNLKNTAEKAWDDALKAGKTPANEKTVKDALQKLRNWQYQYQRLALMNRPVYAKAGTKIKTTYKQKDDLLYKSTRDAVEHFRKMSKMASDAHNRKQPKIQKLASHPKGSTRKYLLGGLAPFLTYTPVALGGETTTSSQVDTSSTTSSKKDKNETLDVIKDLFKNIEGLPSDVNGVYESMSNFLAKSKAFGENLDSDDLASLYLSLMLRLNHIKFSKDLFDKVNEIIKAKDAGSEIAIDLSGRIAVLDINTGKISYKSWDEVKKSKSLTPLTNNNLMLLRAYSPESAFADNIFAVTSNATSMSEIAKFLKALLPSLGSSELTIEGYTKKESQQIKAGIELLKDAPDGFYKYHKYTKELNELAKAALKYLVAVLPKNMKTLLLVNAEMSGTTMGDILTLLVGSGVDTNSLLTFTALTGKASEKKDGDGDDTSKIKSNPLVAMLREIGGVPTRYELVSKDSNTRLSVNGTMYSALPKVKEDMNMELMLSISGIDGILQNRRGITLGDLAIKPEDLKHIMYANNGGMVVTLPCKIVNGTKLVNLDVIDAYERAENEALQIAPDRQSPEFMKALGLALKKEHLDSLLDSRGYPKKDMFALFLAVEAYTTDKVKFKTDSKYIEKVNNPEEVVDRLLMALSSSEGKKKGKADYEIDIKDWWQPFEMTYDDIYRGTMFIPLNNNLNAAINSWGDDTIKLDQTTELENDFLNYNKRSNFNTDNYLNNEE